MALAGYNTHGRRMRSFTAASSRHVLHTLEPRHTQTLSHFNSRVPALLRVACVLQEGGPLLVHDGAVQRRYTIDDFASALQASGEVEELLSQAIKQLEQANLWPVDAL